MGKYSCFSCGKVFTNLQNLRRHYRNLHEGRWYRCGICSSLLSSASGLSRHLRINHGIQVSAPKHKPPVLLPTPPQPYYASRTSIACLTTPAVGGGESISGHRCQPKVLPLCICPPQRRLRPPYAYSLPAVSMVKSTSLKLYTLPGWSLPITYTAKPRGFIIQCVCTVLH